MCNIANRVKNYALKSCILLHRVPPTYKLEVSRLSRFLLKSEEESES